MLSCAAVEVEAEVEADVEAEAEVEGTGGAGVGAIDCLIRSMRDSSSSFSVRNSVLEGSLASPSLSCASWYCDGDRDPKLDQMRRLYRA